jgi:hypothetical protein
MTKRIEKLAKKERKKILKAAGPETAGPMAMQPPRDGDVIDSRRDRPSWQRRTRFSTDGGNMSTRAKPGQI